MANSFNYAQKWQKELIEFITQDVLTSEFITSNVKWLNAKTFHFTLMNTSGYKNHTRTPGFNVGAVTQTDKAYTVAHDRDIEFFVDKADVDETNETASAHNITNVFMVENQNPETDAYFFSKVASTTGAVINQDEVVGTALTKANIITKLKAAIKPLRKYGVKNIRGFVSSDVMELIEMNTELAKTITVQPVAGTDNTTIETRVFVLDGVKIIEVYEADRFYDSFSFTEGFVPVEDVSRPLNFLFCPLSHVVTVPKIASIYLFAPGQHTEGDGYLYQNRAMWDTFAFPNAKTGTVDCITGSSGAVVNNEA